VSYYEQDEATAPDLLTNIDAEAALLGGMLIDNSIITAWADRLRVDDFAEPLHGRIYSALLRFSAKGARASAISLRPIFAKDEAAMHGDYLARLVDSPAAVVGAADFAAQIIELSDRRVARAAVQLADEMLTSNFDTPIMEITGRVEAAGWAASTRSTAKPVRTLGNMVRLAGDRVRRIQDEGEAIGMTNHLVPDLDVILGPLEPGFHLIAGRPGMGKTTLALSAAHGYAINGNPGIYLSAEMTEEQLAMRAATDIGFALGYRIKHDDLRRGKVTPGERMALEKIADRCDLIPLDFVDLRGGNIRRVWSECARKKALLKAEGKDLAFCVVDSVALYAADIDGKLIDDDRKRVNFISAFLNAMAHALDIAVIALNQLSRGVEGRQNKRPMLSDLKESGNLEQDADTVTFIYREEYYLEQTEPRKGETNEKKQDLHEAWEVEMMAARGKADLIGAKNRHGRTMTATVSFHGEFYSVRQREVLSIGNDDPLLV
jgi:replicative DNA helicase